MVKSSGELGYCGEFVLKLGFGHEIFEFVDIFLEPVIRGSILIPSWSLDKFGQVSSSFEFGVERVEIQIIVFGEFHKRLFVRFDTGV